MFLTTFILSKHSTWAPNEEAKTGSQNILLLQRYSRKICVRVLLQHTDTQFLHFAIEYLQEIKIFVKPTLPSGSGP